MKVFVQIGDISDDRFPGEELLDQRITFLRLLMENDKLLSRNLVIIYVLVSSAKEHPPHSSLHLLNIFILKIYWITRWKVANFRSFWFALLDCSRGKLVWIIDFHHFCLVDGLLHSLCLFSFETVVFLLSSLCMNSLYHICRKHFFCGCF